MSLCSDMEGRCFARRGNRCRILKDPTAMPCKFKKPDADVTNGKWYPFNPPEGGEYGDRERVSR